MSEVSYEAKVLSAHLPTQTVTLVYPPEGIPFRAGIFKVEYVRQATPDDEARFPSPDDDVCPCCGSNKW
jgi:hypothetical protein